MAAELKIGSFTGTGAAINIPLGWTPDYIEVVNVTDGDEGWEWYSSMTAAHALKIDVAGVRTRITANGVSAYAGSSTPGSLAAKGVTIGSALSESGKTFAYRAMRNSEY